LCYQAVPAVLASQSMPELYACCGSHKLPCLGDSLHALLTSNVERR